MKITKRYLKIPVSYNASEKNIQFFKNDKLVFDLNVKYDDDCDTYFYADMKNFVGQNLEISSKPSLKLNLTQIDSYQKNYKSKYRPTSHFTASKGWTNDPNGLCYYKGLYHMFFQLNPVGSTWGNMHWGHATSADLYHWDEKEITLFPDEMGTMFSGCAVIDKYNLTGLKTGENDPILLYYTAAGNVSNTSKGQKYTQCLAYSTDAGKNFTKYEKNPVVNHIISGNRDPKVIFVPEANKYYMALYLDGSTYALLSSNNLLDWEKIQEIVLDGDGECPDFYPLVLEETGEKYWIFSGACDFYLVGKINENELFVPVQEIQKLQNGRTSYAAQTFYNTSDDRRIKIAWNTSNIPNSDFNSSMTTPVSLSLKNFDGVLKICVSAVKEFENNYKTSKTFQNINVDSGFTYKLSEKSQDIKFEIDCNQTSVFEIMLNACKFEVNLDQKIIKTIDNPHNIYQLPIDICENKFMLRLISDTTSTEVFTGYGENFCCVSFISDYSLNNLTITSKEKLEISKIEINELENLW